MKDVDFFVEPFASFATATTVWLVLRRDGSPANPVAICDTGEAARKRAVEMASYHCSIGRRARVLQRTQADGEWRVIWPQEDAGGEGADALT